MTATASRTTNRRPELLAPAGGPEPFAAALAAGADAIYCGMGSFNARRKATNFTDEAFEQACRAAHLAGSRVYVTVNIVIKQSEMGDALQLIHRCSTLGADAFIIQDWGLFFEVKRTMPGIETHISTQANIHDDRRNPLVPRAGADRVTLSRELSIDEIAAIHDAAPDVDLEVFSHGAICFCCKQISFQYYDYTGLKKKVLKNKGEVYKLSPYRLLWCGDYYYVLGYSEKKSKGINFRVDRIASKPEILDKDIVPMPDDFNIENYTKEVFFMFSGEKVLVDLRCDNS